MTKSKYDFSGYATKNDLKCSDGRTILKDAFKDNDGQTVPMVWQHLHNEPGNVLGHAVLENREDGVYAYCSFNDTPAGQNAKLLVQHGDIKSLSIYANGLVEKAKAVMHGVIREISLVLSGANPGALIDNLSIAHSDGTDDTVLEDEAVIYTGLDVEIKTADAATHTEEPKSDDVKHTSVVINVQGQQKDDVKHAATPAGTDAGSADETVGDVFDTLTEKQKTAVFAIIADVMDSTDTGASTAQSAINNEGDNVTMKHNVFEDKEVVTRPTLSNDQFKAIVADATQHGGSFRESFLQHAVEYGIENIDYLFPDAQNVTTSPTFVKRDTGWVAVVMNGTYHTPFSRIKTLHADITAEAARAMGYTKGELKKEEVIKLLRRITIPTTVYKKQKLDRDDILDITDLDVVSWLKSEMRIMLDEELARAVMVGDGRDPMSIDHIDEACIRPIWTDDDLYAHHVQIEAADEEGFDANVIVDEIVRARSEYKGSGTPTFFTTSTVVSDMLLLRDTTGRRIYSTQAELEAALRVAAIVEVPVMEGLTRTTDDDVPVDLVLLGIVVNLKDYSIGADKGGAIGMFDDFDIDYNQYKYLMETRCSGALTLPKSALVIEQIATDES